MSSSSSARSLQLRDRRDLGTGDDKGQGVIPGWGESHKDTHISESTWRKRRETTEGSCQTDDLKYVDDGIQAAPLGNDKPIQTDEPSSENYDGKPYPPSLFAFFAKVTEPICEILQENQDPFLNDIFNDYNQQDEESNNVENNMTKLHQLRNENVSQEAGASCVAWSKTGGQIAVGYGHEVHEGWCSHQMPVSVWNINRPESLNTTVPQIEIEFSSCASLLSFHPQENNLLAVGLHSGEIALVDLTLSTYYTSSSVESDSKKKNDAITDIQGTGHAKQIISLKWIRLNQSNISELFKKNPSGSTFALISAAIDGYITLWSVSKTGSRLYLEKQFIVSSENLSEDINVGNRYKLGMKELGLTSLSSCAEDPTTFVFATHGSFVFQGFLLNNVEVSDTSVVRTEKATQDDPLYDPITNIVAEDIGLIIALDCSPFHRNFFLYITTEGSCFLQNLLKPMTPTISIALDVQAIATDVQWSFTRPMLFALADRKCLKFYDLNVFKETSKPVLELEHEENIIKIAFNKTRSDLIAISDVLGFVHVWKMPETITEVQPNEIDDLVHVGQSHIKASKIKVG